MMDESKQGLIQQILDQAQKDFPRIISESDDFEFVSYHHFCQHQTQQILEMDVEELQILKSTLELLPHINIYNKDNQKMTKCQGFFLGLEGEIVVY